MLKSTVNIKALALVLLISIFTPSCKIPDISKFTEASTKMTTAIRLGVTETDSIIETASKRPDLFGEQTASIKDSLKSYREASAPTLKTLSGLDAYLEALNALASAQAKSAENAGAAVNSVASLAAELNILKIPETGIKLGTGLLALAEVLRTERDFKKRVLLADRIVNGASSSSSKPCAENTFEQIEAKTRDYLDKLPGSNTSKKRDAIAKRLKSEIDGIDAKLGALTQEIADIDNQLENATDLDRLALERRKDEKNEEKAKLLEDKETAETGADLEIRDVYNNAFVKLSNDQRTLLEREVGSNTCGIIDVLKINVRYLKRTYNAVAINLYRKTSNNNLVLISYHDNIVLNDKLVQRELRDILRYKQGLFERSQLQNEKDLGIAPPDVDQLIARKSNEVGSSLNSVYVANRYLQKRIADLCSADAACSNEGSSVTGPAHQRIIMPIIDAREIDLLDKNKRYTDDLERIAPAYTEVMTELARIRNKHQQMLKVFDGSIGALDTWGSTHANLRDSVTVKKPFSAARLFGDVRFILETLGINRSDS